MKNTFIKEIATIAIILCLLVFLLNPFNFWMPSDVVLMLAVSLLIFFGIFAGLILREKTRDEREAFHIMLADRIAYLLGSFLLVLGIVLQSIYSHVDFWLILTLGVMLLTKLLVLVWSKMNR